MEDGIPHLLRQFPEGFSDIDPVMLDEGLEKGQEMHGILLGPGHNGAVTE